LQLRRLQITLLRVADPHPILKIGHSLPRASLDSAARKPHFLGIVFELHH
jgi:hypothetical protein